MWLRAGNPPGGYQQPLEICLNRAPQGPNLRAIYPRVRTSQLSVFAINRDRKLWGSGGEEYPIPPRPSHEKFHTVVLNGVRNIKNTPINFLV